MAPCACRTLATAISVHQDGKTIDVEFFESACVKKENRRRIAAGEIDAKYTCYQVRQETTISRDTQGDLVDVTVNRRNGCELRCIVKECGFKG